MLPGSPYAIPLSLVKFIVIKCLLFNALPLIGHLGQVSGGFIFGLTTSARVASGNQKLVRFIWVVFSEILSVSFLSCRTRSSALILLTPCA
jgi:hypothetical protein